ncbi:hypothetical protein BKA62DRAFT_638590 [Auriculariales sp. MPI-PUGE-AT-0066]|nr:hypothetical protein BKA62DRAFT_638590 [Auriculariales sp. MPI-PUGE-AT-0066]
MATGLLAIQALREVGSLTAVPAVQAILGTASLIFESVKVARRNRLACLRVVQLVNETLEVVQSELTKAGTTVLPDEAGNSLERLNKALEGILDFVKHQSQSGLVRRLVNNTSERQAREELSLALVAFQSECLVRLHLETSERDARRGEIQSQTLHLLDSMVEDSTMVTEQLRTSFLPSAGLIIGRDAEQRLVLEQMKAATAASPARIVLLGGGGMGKSTLALSILNHPAVIQQFGKHRYFISCESATSSGGLISDVAAHVGIAGDQLKKRLLAALRSISLLLVLDNFETPWEGVDQRVETEMFLGELSALQNITLIVTMRGSERPLGVAWTTPAIEPLQTLDLTASRQIFSTIASLSGEQEDSVELQQFLKLLDGIPLAITLAANMTCNESLSALLQRWREEGTKAIQGNASTSNQRLSSLDVSIKISVESSRMVNTPGAFELLQLLALLPNGIPEPYSHPFFKHISRSVSALKGSLLASAGKDGRLRSLSPIRLYVLRHHPPPYPLIAPLEQDYAELSIIADKLGTSSTKEVLSHLLAEWANVESVCGYCLDNVVQAAWPISVVVGFDRILFHVGIPESPLLARSSNSPAVSPRQQVSILLRRILRIPSTKDRMTMAQNAMDLAQTLDDEPILAETEHRLGSIHIDRDKIRCALHRYERLGNEYLIQQGLCWQSVGNSEIIRNYRSEALKSFSRASVCFDATDYVAGAATTRLLMSQLYVQRGETLKAERVARECLSLCLSIDYARPLGRIYQGLSSILWTRGQLTEALEISAKSNQIYRRYGLTESLAYNTEFRACILIDMGDIMAARTEFDAAGRFASNLPPQYQTVRTGRAAWLARVEGDFDEAERLARTAFIIARMHNDTSSEILLHFDRAQVDLDRAKDVEEAAAIALATAALHRIILSIILLPRPHDPRDLIKGVSLLGGALLALRQYADAYSVLTWGLEWAKRAHFMADHAVMVVALAQLTNQTAPQSEEKIVAWQNALDASRKVEMGGLVAECESQLSAYGL